MEGKITNREVFLKNLAGNLGREVRNTLMEKPKWEFQPQYQVLKKCTTDQLLNVLKEQCSKIHTELIISSVTNLSRTLSEIVNKNGGGPIVYSKDSRFNEYGLNPLLKNDFLKQGMEVHEWDHYQGEKNIAKAEKANIGLTISDITLAESGTVVLLTNQDQGRVIHFLPTNYICLVPKSTIVPRMTQAAVILKEKMVPSCVNFITGPSNSADIEMNLVVGVHGPVRATYIVIEDR